MKKEGFKRLFCAKAGFTLIELLVVVLIIGILAAVALPQYNKAVKKAQGREVLVALDAMDKALHAYYLSNGTYYGKDFFLKSSELDVELPTLKHWEYNAGDGSPSNVFIQFGSNHDRNHQNIEIFSIPQGLYINASWGNGEKTGIYCSETSESNGRKCSDYFNCQFQGKQECPIGGFTVQNCPIATTTYQYCYLD